MGSSSDASNSTSRFISAQSRQRASSPILGDALGAHADRVSSARVVFSDQNGPKGGVAVRCGVTVSLAGSAAMHVEDEATTAGLALTGALAKLERRLLRRRALVRDSRRRPKKYFAAARELKGEEPA